MYSDLSHTFYHGVVAAYEDYEKARDAPATGLSGHLRAAVNCVVAIYHFREHLPPAIKPSWGQLMRDCSDFELIRGVANASKHKSLTNPGLVSTAEKITQVTDVVRFEDEIGPYSHAQTLVEVKCNDGTSRWLDPAITSCLNYWGKLLKDAKVCNFQKRLPPVEPGSRLVHRSESARNMELQVMRGLSWSDTMRFSVWNYEKGEREAMDFSDGEISMQIYKPPELFLDVTYNHPQHGPIVASIELSKEEGQALHFSESDKERDTHLRELGDKYSEHIQNALNEKLKALEEAQRKTD